MKTTTMSRPLLAALLVLMMAAPVTHGATANDATGMDAQEAEQQIRALMDEALATFDHEPAADASLFARHLKGDGLSESEMLRMAQAMAYLNQDHIEDAERQAFASAAFSGAFGTPQAAYAEAELELIEQTNTELEAELANVEPLAAEMGPQNYRTTIWDGVYGWESYTDYGNYDPRSPYYSYVVDEYYDYTIGAALDDEQNTDLILTQVAYGYRTTWTYLWTIDWCGGWGCFGSYKWVPHYSTIHYYWGYGTVIEHEFPANAGSLGTRIESSDAEMAGYDAMGRLYGQRPARDSVTAPTTDYDHLVPAAPEPVPAGRPALRDLVAQAPGPNYIETVSPVPADPETPELLLPNRHDADPAATSIVVGHEQYGRYTWTPDVLVIRWNNLGAGFENGLTGLETPVATVTITDDYHPIRWNPVTFDVPLAGGLESL
ncbi:MAG: hypothetical protein ACPGQL_01625 [Thermoplasmatota archaeon]